MREKDKMRHTKLRTPVDSQFRSVGGRAFGSSARPPAAMALSAWRDSRGRRQNTPKARSQLYHTLGRTKRKKGKRWAGEKLVERESRWRYAIKRK